jgi:signal transduction histidine kinase
MIGIPSAERWFVCKRKLVIGAALLLMALIGWVDHATGWELSLFVFYAVPLLMVVWQGQRRLAVVLAFVCGAIWWQANSADHPYSREWSYHWASIGRTVYFVLVVLGGNAVRARQESDQTLIETLEKMRRLEREIVEASEHEQRRIGHDLHDGLCQQLAAIGFAARSLADDLSMRGFAEAGKAEEIETLLNDSVSQARDLARGISPVLSGSVALVGALDELAHTAARLTGMNVLFRHDHEAQMVDPEPALHLYRFAQEALNNALRHSRGTSVIISLTREGENVRLTVADDGTGLPANFRASKGMGMKSMEYRSHVIGGKLEIRKNTPHGTMVSCACKMKKQPDHGRNQR